MSVARSFTRESYHYWRTIAVFCLVAQTFCSDAKSASAEDTLEFYAQMGQSDFVSCEMPWAKVIVKNVSKRKLFVAFPVNDQYTTDALFTRESGDTIRATSTICIILSNDFFTKHSLPLDPGDSLIEIWNYTLEYGVGLPTTDGRYRCLEPGAYRTVFWYYRKEHSDTVYFTVSAPSSALIPARDHLYSILRSYYDPDYRKVEERLTTFLSLYDESEFAPLVRLYQMYFYRGGRGEDSLKHLRTCKSVFQQYANHPIALMAWSGIIRGLNKNEIDSLLAEHSKDRSTLRGTILGQWLAMQKNWYN